MTNEAWKLNATAKLTQNQTVSDLIKQQKGELIDLSSTQLQRNGIYIIKLRERLEFNKFKGRYGLHGSASGRSTIGRLDVLTRLIVDYFPKYDEVPPDYRGDLYLEVVPLSFHLIAKEGIALNQLRIFHGKPELSALTPSELANAAPMTYLQEGHPTTSDHGLLRVSLGPAPNFPKSKVVAFKAKEKVEAPVDLTRTPKSHDAKIYFEPEFHNEIGLQMLRERFYILRSVERMFLPNDIAVTCVAYTENLGELRIHYAGFAHPNFGRPPLGKEATNTGAPLIFEARCHSFSVTIREQEHFARIQYYKMSEPTDKPSSYSSQELTLSSYFQDWKEDGTN